MHRNIVLLLGIPLLGACAGSSAHCVVGADCASGACSASGQCIDAPVLEGGAEADGASLADGGPGSADSSSDGGVVVGTDGAPSNCLPNGDGTITEAEVPMAPGLRATYLDAQNVTWSTAGTVDGGALTWDLSGSFSGDQPVVFAAVAPTGTWWADAGAFAGATYYSLLSASQTLQGVFQVGPASLDLLGVVSPTSGATTQTELTYATPIPTLQFPLTVGASWNATSNVTGQADGVLAAYSESYVSTVDEAGILWTPYDTTTPFSVLRVSTVLTRTVGVVPTVTRSFAFVAECFGVVAQVTSTSNEQSTEFSNDAEVRRLTH